MIDTYLPHYPQQAVVQVVYAPYIESDAPFPTGQVGMAELLFAMLVDDPNQQRHHIEWDSVLAAVAYAHCKDMAQRGYFSHVSPEGIGPNQRARDGGFPLPPWYLGGLADNNIESIAGGDPTVQGTWGALLSSPGHRRHVLGEGDLFGGQTQVGIGHYEGGYYGHYWCVLSAHKEG